MARYRKIDIRMWGDREVLRLSRPQPNGQSLWVYLLAGPATGIIPGAYRVREGGLADELGWPLEAFREAFAEVNGDAFRDGVGHGAHKPLAKADWDAGMVWVPNGIKHNPPQSIHVITSWSETWDELPECDLKLEAYHGLRAFVEGMSKGFLKAFDEAIPRPSWKASQKASAIQDQDQDQDQDQEGEPARAHAIRGPGVRGANGHAAPSPAPRASEDSASQKLTARQAAERELDDLDPPFGPVDLLPCWKLWASWEEVAGKGRGSCGECQPHRNRLTVAYGACAKREPRDPEGLWRRMVTAFVASKRASGGRINLAYLCEDFTDWAEQVSRATSNGCANGSENLRPEYQPFPPMPPSRFAKETG